MATPYVESAAIRTERHMLTRAPRVHIEQLCRERGICSESACNLPIIGWCQECDTRGAFHAPKLCAFHLSAHCRSMGHTPCLPYVAHDGRTQSTSQSTQDAPQETPREREYRLALARAEHDREQLRATHGDACGCIECILAEDEATQYAHNPPCSACHGMGCGQCQYTGWR